MSICVGSDGGESNSHSQEGKSFWNHAFNFVGQNQAFNLLVEDSLALDKEMLDLQIGNFECVSGRKAKENSWVKERKMK